MTAKQLAVKSQTGKKMLYIHSISLYPSLINVDINTIYNAILYSKDYHT